MKKQNKILFPTDFSAPALNAFRYALFLADAMEADIELVHAIMPQVESYDLPVISAAATQERLKAAQTAMTAFCDIGLTQVIDQLKNIPNLHSEIKIGGAVQTVVREVGEKEFTLVVMGTRGEHKGIDKWLGSVASGVVDRAPCPVIVVPENVAFKKPLNIAYATDVLDADPFEIWKMARLLRPFNAVIHCVHFSIKEKEEVGFKKMETLKAFFEDQPPMLQMRFYQLPGKQLENDINEFVELHDIDLLVMFHPKRKFLDRLFRHSTTKQMAMRTRVPLLVQKEGL